MKGANIAQMINVLQAMILTDKEKMVLTPTYHVFDMYQAFMGATPYPATVSGPDYVQGDNRMPMVDVSAARGKDGKLYAGDGQYRSGPCGAGGDQPDRHARRAAS